MPTMSNVMGGAALQIRDALAAAAERLAASTVQVRRESAGRGREGAGSGSGVVWRADGLVVTNAHVVGDARRDVVELTDGRRFRAEVVRLDQRRDLAAIVLAGAADGPPLVAAERASADTLRVGQLVFALGHPWGVRNTMTTGIVHALPGATMVGMVRGTRRWLQADVRLAPGNSGGPLADAWGRVVGVNSIIVRGLAFAVPSDAVERFLGAGASGGIGGAAAA
jgi:serine protease Do